MTIIEDDDITNNFKTPGIFKEKLQTLNKQLPAILDDFKKYYVFFNKNPEYPEYQTSFENIKGNMTKLSSDLFVLSNDVQSSTDELNKKLFALNILIQEEKERNRELKLKLGIVEHKNNAATELISDYKNIYSEEYLRNWGLFLSILIIGTSISKISKNPVS
jgi:galactitol-specific phosphotransferase system IIB component